jgi:hypothetical protein
MITPGHLYCYCSLSGQVLSAGIKPPPIKSPRKLVLDTRDSRLQKADDSEPVSLKRLTDSCQKAMVSDIVGKELKGTGFGVYHSVGGNVTTELNDKK